MRATILASIVIIAGCGGQVPTGAAVESLSCPLNGSRHFELLYSDSTSDWDKVIASKPAFVVLGDHKDNTDRTPPAYFHNADPTIRVLTYIPMNYGHSHGDEWLSSCSKDYTLHHACDNSPMDWDCTSINIATRISNAMASGYDGIFFDETPNDPSMMDYVHDCAARVKSAGTGKLVIVNPGAPPPASMFDDNTDIVCVEHDYNTTDYGQINPNPWRWLAVEDGISSLTTAESHYDAFVQNHGYWYGASPSYGTLASFYSSLVSYIDLHAPGAACTSSPPPPPPPPPPPASTSLTVHSYDLDHGSAEVSGLYTVVTDSGGHQTTGFTPLALTLTSGSYSVQVEDYPPYTFARWADGSTTQPRTVAVSGATTLGAYYHSASSSSSSVTVRAYDLDNGNREVTGLFISLTDASGKNSTGFSPFTVTVPTGNVSVVAQNYPPYSFHNWGNGSTAVPLTQSISGATTIQAFYHSKATLTLRSYDLDNGNREVVGLYTIVTDSTGKQTTGFSPLVVSVPAGSTTVDMQDYPPYAFNHWDDGTTPRPRTITISADRTVGGYYHSR